MANETESEIVERHPDDDAISASIRDAINRITWFAAEKQFNETGEVKSIEYMIAEQNATVGE